MDTSQNAGEIAFPWVRKITGGISVLSIVMALLGAMTIVVDVLGRWLFGVSVFTLNEIMSAIFAVAIALTLPAGAANRVNLKIDLLAHLTGPRLDAWLRLLGGVMGQRHPALCHHIQAKTGKKAADMVEMMMRQKDLVNIPILDPRAFELPHRAFAAINQDRPFAMHQHMRRLCALRVLHRATGGAQSDNARG